MALSACKGIGYRQYAGDDRHNYTTDIGVLGLLIYDVAYQNREGKDKHDGEEPDAHNSRQGIKEHLAGDKELQVLKNYHHLRADEYEEHLPKEGGALLLAHLGVVIAVCRNACGYVIYQPEGKEKKDLAYMLCVKGSYGGEAPQTIVCEEEIVGNEYQKECAEYYRKCEEDSAYHLLAADLYAALLEVNGELLVVALDGGEGQKTAEERPHTNHQRSALIPEGQEHRSYVADDKSDEIEGNTEGRAENILFPISLFRSILKSRPGLNLSFSLEKREVRCVEKHKGEEDYEGEEADDTEGVEEGLELPYLIAVADRIGRAESLVKELKR